MKLRIRNSGKVRILDLDGDIRAAVGDQALKDAVQGLLAAGNSHILVNMSQVRFIDTLGLGELVTSWKQARDQGGSLKVSTPSPFVRKVLETTKLHDVFDVFEDELEALGSF